MSRPFEHESYDEICRRIIAWKAKGKNPMRDLLSFEELSEYFALYNEVERRLGEKYVGTLEQLMIDIHE